MTDIATAKEQLSVVPSSKDVFGKKARYFDALAEQIAEAQRVKAQAEKDIRTLKEQIEQYFADSDSKTILSNGSRVTLVLSHNSHVSKELLIEAGIPVDTIAKCTKITNFSFIKVTEEKAL